MKKPLGHDEKESKRPDNKNTDRQPKSGAGKSTQEPNCPYLISDQLFSGHRQLVIEHQQERYYLRITRAGKLILTK